MYTHWTHCRWHAYAEAGHLDEARHQVLIVNDKTDRATHRIPFPDAERLITRLHVAGWARQEWDKPLNPFDLEALFMAVRAFVTDMRKQEASSEFAGI